MNDFSVRLAEPAAFAFDAAALPALLVGVDYRITVASDAARRFLVAGSTADDVTTRVLPPFATLLDDLLTAVFDRAVPRVSRPVDVDLDDGPVRVVVSASPYPSTPDRPLALVLFLEDGGSRPPSPNGVWELGPTTQLESAARSGAGRPGGEAGALIRQVSRLHSDLHNLLQAAEVTALFLDFDLRVRRYAGGLEQLLAISPADIGRPLAELAGGSDTALLAEAAAEVVRTLQPIEREVRGRGGSCHLARLRPHVGTDAQIEGVTVTFVDVTRLKETEARLRSAMEMLDVALDAAEMGWLTWDALTNLVTMDARALLIFGYPAETGSVSLKGLLQRIYPSDLERVYAELEAAQREDRRGSIEFRVANDDGSLRVISGNYLFVREPDGTVVRGSGMFRNITAQRAVEEALQRHTRMLTLAGEASGIGWGSYDPRTGLTVWDARGSEIMGLTGEPGEMTQEAFLALVHPDDRERIAAELAASKTAGGDFRREYRIIRPDGEVRDILGTGAYICDESGAVMHATGLLWDVTERKRQERELREREETLRLAIHAAKLGLWEWDIESDTLTILHTLPGIGRAPGADQLDRRLALSLHPDDAPVAAAAMRAAAAGGPRFQLQYRGRPVDGGEIWMWNEGEVIRDESGRPIRMLGVSVNIQALKDSEQSLRGQAEMLRLANAAAGFGWAISDPAAGVAHWDARAAEIFGYRPEPQTMDLAEVFAHIHPDDRERVRRETGTNLENLSSFEREYRIIRPDGEVRDIVAWGTYARDPADDAARGTGLVWDVTERKRQERALEERERTLRLAIQAANMAVWEWDLPQNALRVMVPLEDMSFPGADSPVESQLEFIHPDDHEALWKAVQGIASGTTLLQVELRGKRSDDTYRWLRAEGELIRDNEGVPVRLLGVSLDIHAQKESELALQRWAETLEERVAGRTQELEDANAHLQAAEARFHSLFEASPVPTVLFRLSDSMTIDVNSAFLGYSGLRREDVIGHPADELRERFSVIESMDAIEQAVKAGQLKDFEHQYLDKHGETRTLIVSVVPIEIDGQPCLLGSSIDITARKVAEQKVRELASELSLAEQHERQRLSSILHDDLQQRLYALQLQLTWLRERAEQDGARSIAGVIDSLLEIVPETVTLTRRLSVDLSPPILRGEGLTEALSWLASQMREQYGLEVDVRSGPRTRYIDDGIRVQVFQVLRELLFNVVKHAGVSRVEVTLVELDDALQVTVRDEGKGFELGGGPAGRSSGRGLATSRQRLELIGCSMEIRSAPGAGTTITIRVPMDWEQGNKKGAQPS